MQVVGGRVKLEVLDQEDVDEHEREVSAHKSVQPLPRVVFPKTNKHMCV